MKQTWLFVALSAVLAVAACRSEPTHSSASGASQAKLTVVTSIPPLAMMVAEIGGSRVAASSLLSAGSSPHTFEARAGDLKLIADAGVIVRVGRGFDDWLQRIVATASSSAEELVVGELDGLAAAPQTELYTSQGDPHVWLDPLLVRDVIAPALAAALARADGTGAATYAGGLSAFQTRLNLLDEEIRSTLLASDGGAREGYVAFHNAWRYFANRYGLHEVDVVYEFAGEEPSPREIAKLIRAARAAGVAAILIEPQLNPRMAEVIARDFGAKTVTVDPLGDLGNATRDSYEEIMTFNASAFARALRGNPGKEPLAR